LGDEAPFFVDCEPELWSRQSMCNINVREYIKLHGGRIQCGYRIWYNGHDYIEAERHAIWTDGSARRDVSFSSDGEVSVLFLPDRHGAQHNYDAGPPKVRMAFTDESRAALRWHEDCWKAAEKNMVQYTDEEGWAAMLSYEEWLKGNRMPNMVIQQTHP
jgi:hypothetical protein